MTGAALLYGMYSESFRLFGRHFDSVRALPPPRPSHPQADVGAGPASVFVSFPIASLSVLGGVVNSFVASALFMFGMLAVLDPRNRIARGAIPTLRRHSRLQRPSQCSWACCWPLSSSASVSMRVRAHARASQPTRPGAAINPARQAGGLVVAASVYGAEVVSAGSYYALVALATPLAGAPAGAALYRLLVHAA